MTRDEMIADVCSHMKEFQEETEIISTICKRGFRINANNTITVYAEKDVDVDTMEKKGIDNIIAMLNQIGDTLGYDVRWRHGDIMQIGDESICICSAIPAEDAKKSVTRNDILDEVITLIKKAYYNPPSSMRPEMVEHCKALHPAVVSNSLVSALIVAIDEMKE